MFSKSTIKYIQSLQHKKFRDESASFVAEGPKVIYELLKDDLFTCVNLFAVKEWISTMPIGLIQKYEGRVVIIKPFELDKISGLSKSNLVVGIFEKRPVGEHLIDGKLTLLLDDIQDPGNVGTLVRIADWFGIKNIYCSLHTADIYNPKVVQSTMASLGRVNIFYTDLEVFLKKCAVPRYAATLGGVPLSEVGKLSEAAIIIGNESKGVSPEIMALADHKITIPGKGQAESLNAAVATGIILYSITV